MLKNIGFISIPTNMELQSGNYKNMQKKFKKNMLRNSSMKYRITVLFSNKKD
jgi:hypothetical protein